MGTSRQWWVYWGGWGFCWLAERKWGKSLTLDMLHIWEISWFSIKKNTKIGVVKCRGGGGNPLDPYEASP